MDRIKEPWLLQLKKEGHYDKFIRENATFQSEKT